VTAAAVQSTRVEEVLQGEPPHLQTLQCRSTTSPLDTIRPVRLQRHTAGGLASSSRTKRGAHLKHVARPAMARGADDQLGVAGDMELSWLLEVGEDLQCKTGSWERAGGQLRRGDQGVHRWHVTAHA
jgi:hypothetical protein